MIVWSANISASRRLKPALLPVAFQETAETQMTVSHCQSIYSNRSARQASLRSCRDLAPTDTCLESDCSRVTTPCKLAKSASWTATMVRATKGILRLNAEICVVRKQCRAETCKLRVNFCAQIFTPPLETSLQHPKNMRAVNR